MPGKTSKKPKTEVGERFDNLWRSRGFKSRNNFLLRAGVVAQTAYRWLFTPTAASRKKLQPIANLIEMDVDELAQYLYEGAGTESHFDAAFAEANASKSERREARGLAGRNATKREVLGIIRALRFARARGATQTEALDSVAEQMDEAAANRARHEAGNKDETDDS